MQRFSETASLSIQERPKVPFLDLRLQHGGITTEILSDLTAIIESSAFTNGQQVAAFERLFADYCGAQHSVGVGSGLDALRFGLLALGVEPGDQVIVPANTFIATWEAIAQTGAVPVPVDISTDDYNIDPAGVAAAVGPNVRAIVPVHLYGQLADMRSIVRLAEKEDLVVLEDAAQAHGAEREGFRAGVAGAAAAFSFYPGKNLGAFGDAGALVTSDAAVAESTRMLREHGQREKYRHDLVGYTSRLDTIQAAVLLRKLPLLEEWNKQRQVVAAHYLESLEGVGDVVLPVVAADSRPVWHLFVIRTGYRGPLAACLRERGIGSGLHYPEPPHLSNAFSHLGFTRGAFPVTEAVADELLSLPIFPGMTEEQVDAVTEGVKAFFSNG